MIVCGVEGEQRGITGTLPRHVKSVLGLSVNQFRPPAFARKPE